MKARIKSCLCSVLGVLLLVATPVWAVHSGLFELDGNALDPVTETQPDDWETLGFTSFPPGDLKGAAKKFTGILPDIAPNTIFTGGRKDIQPIEQWGWKDGAVPDKNNITNAYAAAYLVGGDVIVYFGADRFSNTGDAFLGFWFFKDHVTNVGGGGFSGSHTNGDTLVLANFPQGAKDSPQIKVVQWNSICKKEGDPLAACAAKNLELIKEDTGSNGGIVCSDDTACAITNTDPGDDYSSPWTYIPKDGAPNSFPLESFIEGGINLSAIPGLNPCFSSFMAESRSSSSFTASLKDFVVGEFQLCGVSVTKECDGPAEISGDGQSIDQGFKIKVKNTGLATISNVEVYDSECTVPVPPYDDLGDYIKVDTLTTLAPGVTHTVEGLECTGTTNPARNFAIATATAGTETIKSIPDEIVCPGFNISPLLGLEKSCSTELAVVEDKDGNNVVAVKVTAEITVTNTAGENLKEVRVYDVFNSTQTLVSDCEDTSNGDTFPNNGTDTLDVGENVKCNIDYFPTTADSDPANATFQDTAQALAKGVVSDLTADTGEVDAYCDLCPPQEQ